MNPSNNFSNSGSNELYNSIKTIIITLEALKDYNPDQLREEYIHFLREKQFEQAPEELTAIFDPEHGIFWSEQQYIDLYNNGASKIYIDSIKSSMGSNANALIEPNELDLGASNINIVTHKAEIKNQSDLHQLEKFADDFFKTHFMTQLDVTQVIIPALKKEKTIKDLAAIMLEQNTLRRADQKFIELIDRLEARTADINILRQLREIKEKIAQFNQKAQSHFGLLREITRGIAHTPAWIESFCQKYMSHEQGAEHSFDNMQDVLSSIVRLTISDRNNGSPETFEGSFELVHNSQNDRIMLADATAHAEITESFNRFGGVNVALEAHIKSLNDISALLHAMELSITLHPAVKFDLSRVTYDDNYINNYTDPAELEVIKNTRKACSDLAQKSQNDFDTKPKTSYFPNDVGVTSAGRKEHRNIEEQATIEFSIERSQPKTYSSSFLLKKNLKKPFAEAQNLSDDQFEELKNYIWSTIETLNTYSTRVTDDYLAALAAFQLSSENIAFSDKQKNIWKAFSYKAEDIFEKSPNVRAYLDYIKEGPLTPYIFKDQQIDYVKRKISSSKYPVVKIQKEVKSISDWRILSRAINFFMTCNPQTKFDLSKVSLFIDMSKKELREENLKLKELYSGIKELAQCSTKHQQLIEDIKLETVKDIVCAGTSVRAESAQTNVSLYKFIQGQYPSPLQKTNRL